VRAYPTLNGRSTAGRPSKRSKQLLADLLEAIEAGAPFNLACQSCGIHVDSFQRWRRDDPALAAQVDQAAAKGTIERLKEIGKQGKEGAWPALAWLVERRHPELFSRPEIQLGVAIQNNVNGGGAGSITITLAEAEELEAVADPIREKVRAMMEQYRPGALGNGNAEQAERQPDGELEAPITMPDKPGPAWWDQLIRGADERPVEKATAVMICRKVLEALVGTERARAVPIDFEGEDLNVADVMSALEELSGGATGWRTLLQFAGYAQAQD
jgi:hypothetical protein